MFCKNCGSVLSDDSKFCLKCGSPVDQIEQSSTSESFIREFNGVQFDAVKLAHEQGLFDGGLFPTRKTATELQILAGSGMKDALAFALELQKDESLKAAVMQLREDIKRREIEEADRQESLRRQQADAEDAAGLRCPKCYSKNIKIDEVGYSAAKGIAGAVLTGGIGLLAGFHGRHKLKGKCLKCGYEWKI